MHSNAVAGNNLKEFVREIEILMRMRHPNLVLFMGASCDDKLAVIMEYCKGDNLFKLLHESSHIDISWG
jgi:serine/threonine protein kinase